MSNPLSLDQVAQHGVLVLVPKSATGDPVPRSSGRRRLMTTDEIARVLGVDPSTIRRWRTATPVQGPPFIRLSERVVMYNPDDFDRWLASRRVDPAAA